MSIDKKPPSSIRIRTLESDMEQMRESGGEVNSGRILGKNLEEIQEQPKEKPEENQAIFEEDEIHTILTKDRKKKAKKTFIILGIIIAIMIIIIGGLLLINKSKRLENTTITSTPVPTPNYASLLKISPTERAFLSFSGKLKDLEKIITNEFQNITSTNYVKELVLMKDNVNAFSGLEFLRLAFSNLSGISITNIPPFEDNFSFTIISDEFGNKSLAYVLKINETGLSTFALSNIESVFATDFEQLIEENYEDLTSQYLENPGTIKEPFLTKAVGAVNARYLKFSTGKEFYFAFYQNYLIIATSETSFQKLLEMIAL